MTQPNEADPKDELPIAAGFKIGSTAQKGTLKGKNVPTGWELFLAGERVCPCCACWTFFGLGWLFTIIFILFLTRKGSDVFSFEEQAVKSDKIVQEHFAFQAAKGEIPGCSDKGHEKKDVCANDEDCQWDNMRELCKAKEVCPRPPMKPRELPLQGDGGRPMWIGLIYEAQKGGSIFDDDILRHIDEFERKLMTTANGAKSKGTESPWDKDWCTKVYPSGGPNADGKCGPVTSVVNLFSMTESGRDAVKLQVDNGYSRFGLISKCLCSHKDDLCSICTADGSLKGLSMSNGGATPSLDMSQWPQRVRDCLTAGLPQQSPATTPSAGASDGNTQMCQRDFSLDLSTLGVWAVDHCKTAPSCQWAPPYTSRVCSSNGFFHPKDGEGLVTGSEKQQVLKKLCNQSDPLWWSQRKLILPQSLDCSKADKKSLFARTVFYPGQKKENDVNEYKSFEKDYVSGSAGWYRKVQQLEAEVERNSDGKLRIMLYSAATLRSQFLEILYVDAALSSVSMLLVWGYMWWSLESVFLASAAMFEIVFSLPVAMCIWAVIFQQQILFYQILVIFVILGIGADDAFILYDAWMQARFAGPDVMQHWTTRFAWAYRRAFNAMLVTTATTCGSFIIGATSVLPQVRDFSIFAAMVVFVDWLFCITFFASCIAVYERYIAPTSVPAGQCGGPGCCWGCFKVCAKRLCPGLWGLKSPEIKLGEDGKVPIVEKRRMEHFCEGPLFRFLNRWKIFIIIFWALCTVAFTVNAGVQLRTAKKRSPIGREGIDTIRGFEILLDEFSIFGTPTVSVFFGIDKNDPIVEWGSGEERNIPRYAGAEALVSPEGQRQLLNLCRAPDAGRDTRCEDKSCIILGRPEAGRCPGDTALWRNQGIDVPKDLLCLSGRYCFMEEFARFWAANKGNCKGKAQAACVSPDCAWARAENVCHSTADENSYSGLPAAEFVSMLTGTSFAAHLKKRQDTLRALGRGYEADLEADLTGFRASNDGTSLKFAWVSFNATYPRENTVDQANAVHDNWEAFRDRWAGSIKGAQTTDLYLFMVTQNEMVRAAIMGICLSLLIAFVVLMCITRNWWISLLGLLNIVCVSITFLGIMPLLGWSLGENECIFLIAVVGLSVDYTCHLLHSFHHAHSESRLGRSQSALSNMGISVLNSSITTLLAAAILFGCGFYFFLQFGGFIFFVIGFSILMSITFLMPILMLIGPEGTQGDINCCRCRLRKQTKVDPVDADIVEVGKQSQEI